MASPSTSASTLIPNDSPVDEKDMPATSAAISELFEGIDVIYFVESVFKAISHELEKLAHVCPDTELEIDELERERFKLKRQMQVVSKKLYSLIVKNSMGFNRQVENYEEVRIKAEELLRITRNLRRSIEHGRRKCRLIASILASDYKKRISLVIKRELAVIATLHRSEFKIRELIQEGNVLVFLQMIVEAITASHQYQHYTSVREISHTFLKLLRSMQPQLDELLNSQTKLFQPERYSLLNSAYQFLGNLEEISSKLQNYFRNTLCEVSRTALLDLLKSYTNLEEEHGELVQIPYERLCQFVEPKDVIRSLCEVGRVLIDILQNYHFILKIHIDDDSRKLKTVIERQDEGCQTIEEQNNDVQQQFTLFDTPILVEKGILQKSLIDNVFAIFACACENYNTLLANLHLATLKFDQFLRVIDVSERFRKFGLLHFGNPCLEIEQTLEAQSRSYFDRYHLEKMEEVKMFVESETFTLCPVSVQFTLFDLPDFFFLKEVQNDIGPIAPENGNNEQPETVEEEVAMDSCVTGKQFSFTLLSRTANEEIFPRLTEQIEPKHRWDKRLASKAVSSCNSSSDTFEDNLTDQTETMPNSMPNLCNSALNLLRIIGRYIRMSTLLPSTAEHTIDAIIQLFNYYVYALFTFFCTDLDAQQQQQLFGVNFASLRLRQYIQSVEAKFNVQNSAEGGHLLGENMNIEENPCFTAPKLCPTLNIDDRDKLFLLAERIVGIESATFLAKQLELLRPFFESLLSNKSKGRNPCLDSFYKSLPAVFDLGEAAFGCVAVKAISHTNILKQIQMVDWDLSEIHSQHSAYVDTIVKEFGEFRQGLDRLYAYVHVTDQLHASIWSMMLLSIIRILVQGYSDAKKCSIEGRALQLLDVEQLCGELEELTGLRPLPHRPFAENYIKAFYLPVEELSQWIIHHTEYNLNQTSALLNASNAAASGSSSARKATMSRIMMNLLDVSGIGESGNSLFQ